MRKVAIPKLVYSPWHSWEERLGSQNCEYPGVYMMAISRKDLTGKIPEYKDVSYIGMTNSKAGLKSRWWQFHRSITGYGGHSGGTPYIEKWVTTMTGPNIFMFVQCRCCVM